MVGVSTCVVSFRLMNILSIADTSIYLAAIVNTISGTHTYIPSVTCCFVNKFADIDEEEINIGDTARTLSALRPMGTVIIGDKKLEAQTNGEHISADCDVVITQILPNKVIVKSNK